ncbi:MAG: pilus assembly protein [Fuerstiella sp.]|nr:pilus assembly protein [Fuerstiella sp.]MCP4858266.1 pilus assembly protein [Fuerstiella sp.]
MRLPEFRNTEKRKGTTLVETAVVLPIFFTFLFGFIEFGHVFMTIHTLNSAARRAARLGVGDLTTTDEVETLAHDILDSAIDADLENVKIQVKDASVFDDINVDVEAMDDTYYAALPNVDVEALERGSLFIVRIQVPYGEVGILGPRWIGDINLYGQAVMRKE